MANLYGYLSEKGSLKFLDRKDVIEVQGHVAEIQAILKHCNGSASLDEIRNKVPEIKSRVFDGIVEFCLVEGIIIDSTKLFEQFHQDSENPPVFGQSLSVSEIEKISRPSRKFSQGTVIGTATVSGATSQIARVAFNRKSTRSFSSQPVEIDLLLSLLGVMYSTGEKRPTPSAGGLYPMRVLVVTSDPNQKLEPTVHEYDPGSGNLIRGGQPISGEQLSRSLDTASALNGVVIYLACNLSRLTAKYANRGYRLALIEGGHIAQNAYLFATEQNLAVLELGSFEDKFTAGLLGLNYPEEVVLTALVVGYESLAGKPQFSGQDSHLLYDLKTALVGPTPNKPIESVRLIKFGSAPFEMGKHTAVAIQRPKGVAVSKRGFDRLHLQSTGISTSTATAQLKALVEAYERHSCGSVRVDQVGSGDDLLSRGLEIIDPRRFTPYSKQQFKGVLANLRPFDSRVSWEWAKGRRYSSGQPVYVPIELAFYPVSSKEVRRKLCYSASSNGVAAHFDYEQALTNALLELVERDALAVTWYTQKQVSPVSPASLGNDVFLRTEKWRKLGWESRLLNITLDSVPVCLALLYSNKQYPHLVSGSSASLNFQSAALKALDEAESMLVSWQGMQRSRIKAKEVVSPLDHGLLYHQKSNLHHLGWLLEATESPLPVFNKTLEQALVEFDPVIIDLAMATEKIPLSVVRILSDKLMPINFGFGTEHFDHPRTKVLGLGWARTYPAQPHMLA
jgi:thiazole/oxazole-forming peptide maturase SagD family component